LHNIPQPLLILLFIIINCYRDGDNERFLSDETDCKYLHRNLKFCKNFQLKQQIKNFTENSKQISLTNSHENNKTRDGSENHENYADGKLMSCFVIYAAAAMKKGEIKIQFSRPAFFEKVFLFLLP
jgi:hypothetical protein